MFKRSWLALIMLAGMAGAAPAQSFDPHGGYLQRGYPAHAPVCGPSDRYVARRSYGLDQHRDFGRERTIYRSR